MCRWPRDSSECLGVLHRSYTAVYLCYALGPSNNHQCGDRAESRLWSDLLVIPAHSTSYQCCWFLWGVPEGEAPGVFVPCSLLLGVCSAGRKTKLGAGEYLYSAVLQNSPLLQATGKRCSKHYRYLPYAGVFFALLFGVANLLDLLGRRRELEWEVGTIVEFFGLMHFIWHKITRV